MTSGWLPVTPVTLLQPDLLGDLDQVKTVPARRLRGIPGGSERATQLLDASDDYRVRRRLKSREVDTFPAQPR